VDCYFELPVRNSVSIIDVIVEPGSRAEVAITRPAVVIDVMLLVSAPLPVVLVLAEGLVVTLMGGVVVALVGGMPMTRVVGLRPAIVGSAMAVVVVIAGARPHSAGSEQQHREKRDDRTGEPFGSCLSVSSHYNSSYLWTCPFDAAIPEKFSGSGTGRSLSQAAF
jgi:hypothetical protein